MGLHFANTDRLLAFMRALPAEHFDMRNSHRPSCKTPGCIAGCGKAIFGEMYWEFVGFELGLSDRQTKSLFAPPGFSTKYKNFPLARAIDVVQYLRDTAAADPNGVGVVDWDRFPAENYRTPPPPKLAWTPPAAIEVHAELPESLTSLLRQPVEAGHG